MRKNDKFKKITAVMAAAALTVTSFTACGDKNGERKKNDISESEVLTENTMPIANGDVELSIWMENRSQGYLKSYNDAKAVKILQEKTGLKLKFQHPTGAAAEQLNIMLASGDLPDMIHYSWKSRKKEIESGLFLNLKEYIEKSAPTFRALLDENEEYKNEYYSAYGTDIAAAFPMIADDDRFLCYDGYFIRKDWLDKLGLSVPETIEDWEKVLTAFKEGDPNGNGKKDEIGFSSYAYMTNYLFMPAFDICTLGYYINPKTGKITHAVLEKGFKNYLETMNRWYKKGLLNPSYLTTTGKELDSMVLNNELGAFHSDNNNSMPKYMQGNPDMQLVAVPFPKSSDGKQYTSQLSVKQRIRNFGTFVTSSCKNVTEAVRFLDYLYTDEGATLMNWGVEGETFKTDENGNKYFTDSIMKNKDGKTPYEAIAQYMPNTGFSGFNSYSAANALEANFPERLKKVKEASVNYSLNADKSMLLSTVPTTIEEDEEISSYSADLDTYISEMYSKFIMGSEPLENYDSFVKNAKKLGIEKIIKIKQKAYDRMK